MVVEATGLLVICDSGTKTLIHPPGPQASPGLPPPSHLSPTPHPRPGTSTRVARAEGDRLGLQLAHLWPQAPGGRWGPTTGTATCWKSCSIGRFHYGQQSLRWWGNQPSTASRIPSGAQRPPPCTEQIGQNCIGSDTGEWLLFLGTQPGWAGLRARACWHKLLGEKTALVLETLAGVLAVGVGRSPHLLRAKELSRHIYPSEPTHSATSTQKGEGSVARITVPGAQILVLCLKGCVILERDLPFYQCLAVLYCKWQLMNRWTPSTTDNVL